MRLLFHMPDKRLPNRSLALAFRRTAMRRWDRLLDSYIEEYRNRGVSPQSVAYTETRLHRWGGDG